MSRKRRILEKQQLENYISQGYNKTQLCSIFKIDTVTLNKNLNYYDLKIIKPKEKHYRVRPDINKQWLIDNWVNTSHSVKQLEKRENTKGIIDARINYYKLHKKFKYHVNTSKLFDIKDPNIWYLAGLIATDGYLADFPDSFEITLVGESEKKLLKDIRDYLESTAPVNEYNNSYRLKISANGIREFLNKNFNIPFKNKTFEVGTPINLINEDCSKAYILGCLDGDGCIGNDEVSICNGSLKFIEGLKHIINKYLYLKFNVRMEKRKTTNNSYPIIAISGKKAKLLLDWVYSSSCCLKLERKYLKYKGNDIV